MMLLQANQLHCERDDRTLFSDLNLTVAKGDLLQIKGPNGCGKTTLLRILAGLFHGYSGDVFWQEKRITQVPADYVSDMLYLGHQTGVKTQLTPEENVRWYSQLHKHISRDTIFAALEAVGLRGFETLLCEHLSEGQKRRVALARLIISDATLWILDEPFSAIDQGGIAQLETILADHVAQGGAVVLTTHHTLSMNDNVRSINLGSAL